MGQAVASKCSATSDRMADVNVGIESGARDRQTTRGTVRNGSEVDVIYIAGTPRSGSTLLERLLAESPGLCSVGELNRVWKTGMVQNAPCSCGRNFLECSFWSQVVGDAFPAWKDADALRIHRLRKSVARFRHVPALIRESSKVSSSPGFAELVEATTRIYSSIMKVADCSSILDSSKSSVYPFLLARMPGIRIRVISITRDSRAVANSWARKKLHHREDDGTPKYFQQCGPAKVSRDWTLDQICGSLLPLAGIRSIRVRYEDLARQPAAELARILRYLDIPNLPNSLKDLEDGGSVTLRPTCIFSGNPVRFESSIRVLPDNRWRDEMSARNKAITTAMRVPFLIRHGYLWRK